MWVLGPIGFTAPWLLLGLLGLPVLWLLLKAVPPAPLRRRFPGVALLLGLQDEEVQADKTPWWLLALRMLAVAALIIGLAGPVLNPRVERANSGPLLVLLDASWASAPDWQQRLTQITAQLDTANSAGRVVCILSATQKAPEICPFLPPQDWRSRLAGIEPAARAPDHAAFMALAEELEEGTETFWISDGLTYPGREALATALAQKGDVSVFETGRDVVALGEIKAEDTGLTVRLLRSADTREATIMLQAFGPDPAGQLRVLEQQEVIFDVGQTDQTVAFELPPEIRNRLTRLQIADVPSAGAVRLTDDSVKRLELGLVRTQADDGLQLLSPLHYIRAALEGKLDIIDGALEDLLAANPDMLVLADIAQLSNAEAVPLLDWIDAGGVLIRFSGPRLAASDVARNDADPLLPVRLRAGGRSIGGAMSWGEPKTLRSFAETSPFYGLDIPEEVQVSAQILAQPDPELSERTIAALGDGTPLVTRSTVGQGQIVLFHVTANAEWSNLPLSGLFVQMLDRLTLLAGGKPSDARALEGQMLQIDTELTGRGQLSQATPLPPVAGEDFAKARSSAQTPAGLYRASEATLALNVIEDEASLTSAEWTEDVTFVGAVKANERPLMRELLMAAGLFLLADIFASLALSGRLRGARALGVLLFAVAFVQSADPVFAQDAARNAGEDAKAVAASQAVTFAYVITGDKAVDDMSLAGMSGLRAILYQRTSVEPAAPVGVDLETDDLGFFPILYWPISPSQPIPSAAAYAKLNTYLRTGGVILFDTRDADLADLGAVTENSVALQKLARPLDAPPLEIAPEDHVLTRAFYLLRDFPGRHQTASLWVEKPIAPVEDVEGMPFRNLNDNVSPVIVGGGDWAAAWATDDTGRPLVQIGRGFAGERQREIAARFGVNLIMYVLTGSYKSDQVHVPALLERLGQ